MRPECPVPLLPLLTLAGLLAACAPGPPASEAVPPVDAAAEIPPIPICRDEMRAFVELAHLAKQHGDGWVVFEPAVDALKQQIIDCIDDNRDRYKGTRFWKLFPEGPPPNGRQLQVLPPPRGGRRT